MAEKGWDLSVFRMHQNDPVPTKWEVFNPFGPKHKGKKIPPAFDDVGTAYMWFVQRLMSPDVPLKKWREKHRNLWRT